VKEWTSTLPNELSLGELKSWWTPKFLESDCRGQKSLDWGVFYIIEKLLELKCLKWVRMAHLDTSNTSYGQKKGQKSNCQFNSQPLKVENRLRLPCVQVACHIPLENSWQGLQLCFRVHFIGGPHTKLWAPKVTGVPTLGISGLPLGSPGTKWHLGVGPVAGHKYTIRGKVVASPKFGPWWVLWIRVYM
jgi:hypothetical protein